MFINFDFKLIIILSGFHPGSKWTTTKKLIDFGWNSPYAADLINDIKKYEKGPFDGVTIKIAKSAGAGNVFMVEDLRKISNDSMELERNMMAKVPESNTLTDNFVVIYGGSQMNCFSDTAQSSSENQFIWDAP